jgi:DNA-binding FadR family transcriptional regulator
MIALSDPPYRSGKSCFDYRVGIEGEAAAAAARNRTSDDLIRLADAMARLEEPEVQSHLGLHEDFAFHLLIARASRNDYFVSALQSLKGTIFEGMLLARTPSGPAVAEKLSAINRQHRLIYEAVVGQDAEGAREAMRRHLTRCKRSTSQWYLGEAPGGR